MTVALIAAALIGQTAAKPAQPAEPVTLSRVFKTGETLNYKFNSLVTTEIRHYGSDTFLPRDFGYEYTFSIKVNKVDSEGMADIRYDRPKVTQIIGEYGEQPEVRRAEPGGGQKVDAKISPINEVLEVTDATKPKPKANPKPNKPLMLNSARRIQVTDQIAGQFLGQIYQIALQIGGLDSSLDIAPKLPFVPVKVGSVWKKTAGFQPQTTGSNKKPVVQRLDYTYTYQGITTLNGKQVHKVTAELSLDTDFGAFLNEQYGMTPEQSGVKSLAAKFSSKLEFYLAMGSLAPIKSTADSVGSTVLMVVGLKEPYEEEKFTGHSELIKTAG